MSQLPTLYQHYTAGGITSGLVPTADGFLLNGKPLRLVSGAMHYFRIHPNYWRDRLRKLRATGANAVETYECQLFFKDLLTNIFTIVAVISRGTCMNPRRAFTILAREIMTCLHSWIWSLSSKLLKKRIFSFSSGRVRTSVPSGTLVVFQGLRTCFTRFLKIPHLIHFQLAND